MKNRFRRRAWLTWSITALLAVAALELTLRFGLGLGDPPRLQRDANCEYRFVPSRSYRRFGHRIEYNEWSMRSRPLPRHKQSASELRVLILGDSVVNGGSATDQAELATTLLEQRLAAALAPRIVRVGNASAGSWGPQNIAGYVREFGLFDADWVIIVLSTHDLTDVIGGAPVELPPEYWGPLAGITEALTAYAPQLLPRLSVSKRAAEQAPKPASTAALELDEIETTTRALHELAAFIDDAGTPALVLLHPERSELEVSLPGRADLRRKLEQAGFAVVDLIPVFLAAVQAGQEPYRDPIHPSAEGQELLAEALFDAVAPALGAEAGAP